MKTAINQGMNRRAALRLMGLAPFAFGGAAQALAAEAAGTTRLGVCTNSFDVHWRAGKNDPPGAGFRTALDFIDHCQRFGAGGVQLTVGGWDQVLAGKVRAKLESYGMYLEGQAGLPRSAAEVERFEASLRMAKEAGCAVVRTAVLSGRRYETFENAEAFRQFAEKGEQALRLAEPIARKLRLRLAVENHKDWRIAELVGLMGRMGSEYVGICVDLGNSIALLEEPMAVIEAYAPMAFTTHVKDMAVQEYTEGFLLSEVPLGEGFLDLPKMLATLRRARSDIRFNLEMITRDPLKVPCLTKKYWAVMAGTPGNDLADTLALVRAKAAKSPLPGVIGLSDDEKLRAEDENIQRCFAYARRAGI